MNEAEQRAVSALKKGDISGLETLVRLYQLPAVRAAYGIVGDRHAAEDIVADAFLTVYDRIKGFDVDRPFAPWFYKIVVNSALKVAHSNRRVTDISEDTCDVNKLSDRSTIPEAAAEYKEMRLLLLEALYTLPPRQRAVLVLRYYLEMDEASIAKTLSCPLGTVKWRLHAAKQKLRDSLVLEALADGFGE